MEWPRVPVPPGVAERDWRDWTWQMQHRITSAAALAAFVTPSDDERRAIETRQSFLVAHELKGVG